MSANESKVWLITGASSGLGYEFAKIALESGYRVIGVSRNIDSLQKLKDTYRDNLLQISLDITSREKVFKEIEKAHEHFGRIDVVINNAGNMILGMVEEHNEETVRSQMETNFFGSVWVTQASLPYMRKQNGGHIIQISSIGGTITGPMAGMYSASKFALEGFSEALAKEVAHFGIKVSIVEPGGYWTNLYLKMGFAQQMQEYDVVREKLAENAPETVDSDPRLAAEAVLKIVQSNNPPEHIVLGSVLYDAAVDKLQSRIAHWENWEKVSRESEKAIPAPEGYGQ